MEEETKEGVVVEELMNSVEEKTEAEEVVEGVVAMAAKVVE